MTSPIAGEWADDSYVNVTGVDEAVAAVDNVTTNLYAIDGQLGAITRWWGPPINYQPGNRVNGPLRIDLWGELGHAAIRWTPTNEYAVDPDAPGTTNDLTVMETSEAPMVTVPARLIRCTIDTAKQAVTEYIQTHQRPTCLTWHLVL